MPTALDVHLAEYNTLREETLNRIQIQFNAVTWLFAAIAGVSAALTFTYEKIGVHNLVWLMQIAVVFCPLVVSPIAFMVFDHMVMIHRLGAYMTSALRPRIVDLATDATVLAWDPLKDAPRETIRSIRYCFFLFGSWFLYALLIPVATVYVTVAAWWRWPLPALVVVDWALTAGFVYSSIAVWNERAGWLGMKPIRLPF